jgi:hypothetical protein
MPEPKKEVVKKDVVFPTRRQQGYHKPIVAVPERGSQQARKRLLK